MAYKCMQHWNGNQLCAIDTETTGLDPHYHEIIQVAILPLDADIKVRRDVLPFYINIIPEHPERFDKKASQVNGLKFSDIVKNGFDKEKARDLLEDWISKLGLPLNAGGINSCKIIPLGHNYAFDIGFLKRWLGIEFYEQYFHYHFRDTMSAALYMNDRAAMHGDSVPYPKVNLSYLASCLKIENLKAHDALQDCVTTAEVYRQITQQGVFG